MSRISQDIYNHYSQEIEQVILTLSKITSRSPDEIKPCLDRLIQSMSQKHDRLVNVSSG